MKRKLTLISLAILSWNLSSCDENCSAMACSSFARIKLAVPAVALALSQTWTVKVCQNSSCYSGAAKPLASDPAATNFAITLNGSTTSSHATTDPAPYVHVTAWEGSWEILWDFARDEPIKDGDRYQVTVSDATGATIASLDKTANYVRRAPNGETCRPVCQQAVIE